MIDPYEVIGELQNTIAEFQQEIEDFKNIDNWISVEDEMPKDRGLENKSLNIQTLISGKIRLVPGSWNEGSPYDKEREPRGWDSVFGHLEDDQVKYWQSLPKAREI